jgi:hypothetical protein
MPAVEGFQGLALLSSPAKEAGQALRSVQGLASLSSLRSVQGFNNLKIQQFED